MQVMTHCKAALLNCARSLLNIVSFFFLQASYATRCNDSFITVITVTNAVDQAMSYLPHTDLLNCLHFEEISGRRRESDTGGVCSSIHMCVCVCVCRKPL